MYFNLKPPLFSAWVSQGPRAKSIPDDSIFSNNYDALNFDDEMILFKFCFI